MGKYTKKDLEKLNKSYKKIFKTSGCRILSNEEIQNINESLSLLSSDDIKIIEKAKNGNYAQFNDASPLVRNYIGTIAWNKFVSEVNISSSQLSLSNEQVKKYLQEHVLDAGFRVGLSAMKHSFPDNNNLKELDEYANEYLLVKTLSIPSKENVEALSKRIGVRVTQNELEKNLAKQVVLAKTLFLTQLGQYSLRDDNHTKDYVGSIAETFAHGGRTNFILPHNDINNEVLKAFEGVEIGKTAEIKSRIAATHSATQRKVNVDLSIKSESKEENPKFYQVGKIFTNQYGMNIAIGGIGELGPNQKPIISDGSAGHMYIRKQQGDANTCGSLMVGIESAASLKTSYTGHFHTPLAKSSKQSAFLADKFGPGNKIGGKTVDLSGLDSKQLAAVLKAFEESYVALQKTNPNTLNKVNGMLAGKRLSENKLIYLMTEILDMKQDFIKNFVTDARKGLDACVKRETNSLSRQFENVFGSDISSKAITESVKVMQKNEDNKWILTNLFTQNDAPEQRFSKFWQSVQRGNQLYLTSNSKLNLTKIDVTNKNISLGENVGKINMTIPKEPSRLKKALHSISRGLLFSSTMKQYELQKEAFEKQAIVNSFIEEHKSVVEQSQREIVTKEERLIFKEMLAKSLEQKKGLEKAPQVKASVSIDSIAPEV